MKRRCRIFRLITGLFLIAGMPLSHAQLAPVQLSGDGIVEMNDVTLYPASNNPQQLFYLPSGLDLSIDKAGNPQLLFMKYEASRSGGLFHALFNFELPKKKASDLEISVNNAFTENVQISLYPFSRNSEYIRTDSIPFTFSLLHPGENTAEPVFDIYGSLNNQGGIVAGQIPHEEAGRLWDALEQQKSHVLLSIDLYYVADLQDDELFIRLDPSSTQTIVNRHFGDEADPDSLKTFLTEKWATGELDIQVNGNGTSSQPERNTLAIEKLLDILTTHSNADVHISISETTVITRTEIITRKNGKEERTIKETHSSGTPEASQKIKLIDPDDLPHTKIKYALTQGPVRQIPITLILDLSALFRKDSNKNQQFKKL